MSKKKTQRRHVSLLTIRKNKTKKEQKEKFIKKKRPKGKTKISVQQSRNVRLATIVSPIDRRNDRTCSKKKKKRISLRAPFRHPAFSPDVSLLSPRFLLSASPTPFLPFCLALVLSQLSLPPPFLHNFCLPSWGYHHCRKQKGNGAFTTGWCKQPGRRYIRLSSMQASKVHVCLKETPSIARGCGVTYLSVHAILRNFLKIKVRRDWMRISSNLSNDFRYRYFYSNTVGFFGFVDRDQEVDRKF